MAIVETVTPAIAAIKTARGIARFEMVGLLANIKPKQKIEHAKAIKTAGLTRFPNCTIVPWSIVPAPVMVAAVTIAPEFRKPTKQINPPKAAEIISLRFLGMESIIHFLTGVSDIAKKIIPDIVNNIIACTQVYPAPKATVYVI